MTSPPPRPAAAPPGSAAGAATVAAAVGSVPAAAVVVLAAAAGLLGAPAPVPRAAAVEPAATVAATEVPGEGAPDLEVVALQTTGPGRIGDCNAVVARLHNAGAAVTATAPEVRLEVRGPAVWSRVAWVPAPLPPGATVEVWFERVPLPPGLSSLVALADPAGGLAESNETNNERAVGREPRVACDAPEPERAARELRVEVRRSDGGAGTAAVAGAAVTAASPLGSGVPLGRGTTGQDGRASLRVAAGERTPVLRVAAEAPGCAPGARVITLSGGRTDPIEVGIELDCEGGDDVLAAVAPGTLEIEAALPGELSIDGGEPVPIRPGTRIAVHRPGGRVTLRATGATGAVFHQRTVTVPPDRALSVVVDAAPMRAIEGGPAIEDLRTGLSWVVAASSTASFAEAVARCAELERAGTDDWRLPTIDELAFALPALARAAEPAAATDPAALPPWAPELPRCCAWSTTEHAVGGRLTFYRDGGHIYGRRPEEAGIGALCVRGEAYPIDPLLVPERYRDRVPGPRTFAP